MSSFTEVKKHYDKMRKCDYEGILSITFSSSLRLVIEGTMEYLGSCTKLSLVSKVPNKEYFSFARNNKHSRPVRKDLFTSDYLKIQNFMDALDAGTASEMKSIDIDRAVYSIAIGFCSLVDIEKERDQKTPGTFFEYFIGYCFSRQFGISPRKRLDVLNIEKATSLPTDYIFDLGPNKPKFHVPVKTSTRERVIQVWAHQRVLDGVYGNGRFFGTLTCLTETKLDRNNLEVVEICLPQQWQLYQMFIARMTRVYYLDMPDVYKRLNDEFPRIQVKTFSEFIKESSRLSNFV